MSCQHGVLAACAGAAASITAAADTEPMTTPVRWAVFISVSARWEGTEGLAGQRQSRSVQSNWKASAKFAMLAPFTGLWEAHPWR
jgi:hypothetical protein